MLVNQQSSERQKGYQFVETEAIGAAECINAKEILVSKMLTKAGGRKPPNHLLLSSSKAGKLRVFKCIAQMYCNALVQYI